MKMFLFGEILSLNARLHCQKSLPPFLRVYARKVRMIGGHISGAF